jgi:hypothetical protein
MNSKQLLEVIKATDVNPLELLLETLNELKLENGFEQDLLTPGFMKEWLVSEILGHKCHKTKHGADATSQDGTQNYEYLTCKKGGSYQLDRIHKDNLHRIERNSKFYFAQFDKTDGLKCQKIWEVETDVLLAEAKIKIEKMKKSSNHIGFGDKWVKKNGRLIYQK